MARPGWHRAALICLFLPGITGAAAEESPLFDWPVACEIGRSCFIQNYVDADPTPSAKDHQCGSLTYEGHNGTDIRLPTLAAQQTGFDVLAAAAGRVLRRRDGMADRSIAETGRAAVKGSECGNAVVIGHADGWETQYCHMAKGSLLVKVGDAVAARQPIGRIGLSGLTEYPHLHFIVRHHGEVADPFAHGAPPNSCGAGRMLWQPPLHPLLAYRQRVVLNAGFAAAPVTMAMLEAGEIESNLPGADAPALVAYVRGIGLKAGDVQSLRLIGSSGKIIGNNLAQPLDRNQAQTLIFAGARKPPGGWERGTYRASYRVINQTQTLLEQDFEIVLR